MKEWVQEVLQCPTCSSSLTEDGDYLVCGCGKSYPIIREIPVFTDDWSMKEDEMEENRYPRAPDVIPAIAQLCSQHSSSPNLDVGCGTGRNLSVFSGRVLGCDVDLQSLILAQRRANVLGIDAEFVCADGSSLPFVANSFSFVMSSEVIEHVPSDERERFSQELRRVAEPRGYVIISAPVRNPFAERLADFGHAIGLLDERDLNEDGEHPRVSITELSELGFDSHGCLDAPAWSSLKSRRLDFFAGAFDKLAWHLPFLSTHAIGISRPT